MWVFLSRLLFGGGDPCQNPFSDRFCKVGN
jgi:hypothetical protein